MPRRSPGFAARLDGLPLAIELAAARLRVLSPEPLLARLDDRLRLLTGGPATNPPACKPCATPSPGATTSSPHPEQTLFRRLAVFSGGFTLEAAEAVAGPPPPSSIRSPRLSTRASSLRIAQPDGIPLFGLLETIREFGAERLIASGEAETVRARHAAYYLGLAERADQAPMSPAKDDLLRDLDAALPNLRAALEWAAARDDPEPCSGW